MAEVTQKERLQLNKTNVQQNKNNSKEGEKFEMDTFKGLTDLKLQMSSPVWKENRLASAKDKRRLRRD